MSTRQQIYLGRGAWKKFRICCRTDSASGVVSVQNDRPRSCWYKSSEYTIFSKRSIQEVVSSGQVLYAEVAILARGMNRNLHGKHSLSHSDVSSPVRSRVHRLVMDLRNQHVFSSWSKTGSVPSVPSKKDVHSQSSIRIEDGRSGLEIWDHGN